MKHKRGGEVITTKIKDPKINLKDNRFIRLDGKPESDKQNFFFEQYYLLSPDERNPNRLHTKMLKEYQKDQEQYKQAEEEHSLDNTKPKPEYKFPYKVPSYQTFYDWCKDCCWEERIADRNYKALETIKDEALDYTRYMYQSNKELHMKAVNFSKGVLQVNNILMSTLLSINPVTEQENYKALMDLQTKAGYLYTNVASHQFHSTDVINSNLITLDELREFKEQIQSHHNLYNTSKDYYEETMKLIEDGFKFFEGDED